MSKRNLAKTGAQIVRDRPDIYGFHDYREFLKAWFEHEKRRRALTLQLLSERANLALGYFSMVLSGQRNLSLKALVKLAPHLELKPAELQHLEYLVRMESSPT